MGLRVVTQPEEGQIPVQQNPPGNEDTQPADLRFLHPPSTSDRMTDTEIEIPWTLFVLPRTEDEGLYENWQSECRVVFKEVLDRSMHKKHLGANSLGMPC